MQADESGKSVRMQVSARAEYDWIRAACEHASKTDYAPLEPAAKRIQDKLWSVLMDTGWDLSTRLDRVTGSVRNIDFRRILQGLGRFCQELQTAAERIIAADAWTSN